MSPGVGAVPHFPKQLSCEPQDASVSYTQKAMYEASINLHLMTSRISKLCPFFLRTWAHKQTSKRVLNTEHL